MDQEELRIPAASVKPFVPRSRCKRVNWRKLGSVNIDALGQRADHAELQSHLAYVTFCDAEAEFAGKANDPGLIKLFRLAQLELEYLLHTQEVLAASVDELANRFQEANSELDKLRKERKILKAALAKSSAASNPCPECPKIFSNPDFLESHLSRRHGARSTELLDINRRLEIDLQAIRNELEGLKANAVEERVTDDSNPKQPAFDLKEIKKMFASELETRLSNFAAAHVLPPPPPAASPAPPPPPPIDTNQLKEEICGRLSTELSSMKRQLLNQDQFWKNQISNLEQVHKLELEAVKEKIDALKERGPEMASNPLYASEDVLNRILDSQKRQEEMLRTQESELRQLKEDSQRREASAASLLSLTTSQQLGLGRSYEEIGALDHQLRPETPPSIRHQRQDTDHRSSAFGCSKAAEKRTEEHDGSSAVKGKAVSKNLASSSDGSRLAEEDSEQESASEDEEAGLPAGLDDNVEVDAEKIKKKGGKLGGLMQTIRQSFAFRKKRRDEEPEKAAVSSSGSRRRLDFSPSSSKQFMTSTPKKPGDVKRGSRSADRSDELVGHWWENEEQIKSGSKRLLRMADWSTHASTASLPQSPGTSATTQKFATLPSRRGRKSVSFVDDCERHSRSDDDGEFRRESSAWTGSADANPRAAASSAGSRAGAGSSKMSVEDLCNELSARKQPQVPTPRPVPTPRSSTSAAAGPSAPASDKSSSWDDSSEED